MSTTAKTFTCDRCNRSFAWYPEIAGKRVTCKCGEMMFVPETVAEPAIVDDALYDAAAMEQNSSARRRRGGLTIATAIFGTLGAFLAALIPFKLGRGGTRATRSARD
jgi:hypothetical protein